MLDLSDDEDQNQFDKQKYVKTKVHEESKGTHMTQTEAITFRGQSSELMINSRRDQRQKSN